VDYDEVEGDDVLGDDVLGDEEDFQVVGAVRRPVRRLRAARAPVRRGMMLTRPRWRNQLAPGVPIPGQRLQPLPLPTTAFSQRRSRISTSWRVRRFRFGPSAFSRPCVAAAPREFSFWR